MTHQTLRVPINLADEITRRARIKSVPIADLHWLQIERGALLESVETAVTKPIPPAYWRLFEAMIETRKHPAVARRGA